jgi:4a-hydroxytetrahydrobiopterin dehydratase
MAELLTDVLIESELSALEGWERDGESITKTFDRGDFKGAVDFLNAVTPIAEQMNHHPDVAISWKDVTLTLSTHSAGGLTDNDFKLARAIEQAA